MAAGLARGAAGVGARGGRLRPVAGAVYRRPVAACGAFSILGFACLAGLTMMVSDPDKVDPSKLYLPKDDMFRIASDYHDAHFERQRLASYIIQADPPGPVLTRQAVLAYFAWRADVYALEVEDHLGRTHTLGDPVKKPVKGRDICSDSYMNMGLPTIPGANIPPSQGCQHFSVAWMWRNDPAAVARMGDAEVAATAARGGIDECRSNDTGAVCFQPPYNLPLGMVVGGPCGPRACADGRPPTALQGWIFLDDIRDNKADFTADQWKDLVVKWERKFVDLAEGRVPGKGRYPGVVVRATTESAVTDQVADDVRAALPAVLACSVLLLGAPLALLAPRAAGSPAARAAALGATAGAVMLGGVGAPIGACCLAGAQFAQAAAFIIYPLILLSVVHALHFLRRLGTHLAAPAADPAAAFAAAYSDAVCAAVRCGAAAFVGVGAVAWRPGAAGGFDGVLWVVMVSGVTRALTVAFGVAPVWALAVRRPPAADAGGDADTGAETGTETCCDTPTATDSGSETLGTVGIKVACGEAAPAAGAPPRPPPALGAAASLGCVAALALSGVACGYSAPRIDDTFGRQDLVDPRTKQGEFFRSSNRLFEPWSPFRTEVMLPYRDWSDPAQGRKFYELTQRITYHPHIAKDATVPEMFGYGFRRWDAGTSWYANVIDWVVHTQDHPLPLVDGKFPPNSGTGPGTWHAHFGKWAGMMDVARAARFTGVSIPPPLAEPVPTPDVPVRRSGGLMSPYELDPTRPSRLTTYTIPLNTLAKYREVFDSCAQLSKEYAELGVMWFIPSFVNIKPFAHIHEWTMLLLWAAPAVAFPCYALLRPGADAALTCALSGAAFIALCVSEQQQLGINFDPLTLPWTACLPSLALSFFAVVCDTAGAAAAVDGAVAAAGAGLAAGAAGGAAYGLIHTPVMTKPALALSLAGVTAAGIAALWSLPLRLFWAPSRPGLPHPTGPAAEVAGWLRRAAAAVRAPASDAAETDKLLPHKSAATASDALPSPYPSTVALPVPELDP